MNNKTSRKNPSEKKEKKMNRVKETENSCNAIFKLLIPKETHKASQ